MPTILGRGAGDWGGDFLTLHSLRLGRRQRRREGRGGEGSRAVIEAESARTDETPGNRASVWQINEWCFLIHGLMTDPPSGPDLLRTYCCQMR